MPLSGFGGRSKVQLLPSKDVRMSNTESPPTLDFGRIEEGCIVQRSFSLVNSGTRPGFVVLSIVPGTSIHPERMAGEQFQSDATLGGRLQLISAHTSQVMQPGEERTVTIQLSPQRGDSDSDLWHVLRAMLIFVSGDELHRQQQLIARRSGEGLDKYLLPSGVPFVFNEPTFRTQMESMQLLVCAEAMAAAALPARMSQRPRALPPSPTLSNSSCAEAESSAVVIRRVANAHTDEQYAGIELGCAHDLWELKPSQVILAPVPNLGADCGAPFDVATTFLLVNGSKAPLPFRIAALPSSVIASPMNGLVPPKVSGQLCWRAMGFYCAANSSLTPCTPAPSPSHTVGFPHRCEDDVSARSRRSG